MRDNASVVPRGDQSASIRLSSRSGQATDIDPLVVDGLPEGLEIQRPIVIAVIDSGFDLDHPSINYVDQALHFSATQSMQRPYRTAPYDAGPSQRTHGTAVAGIAAAKPMTLRRGRESVVVEGMAPGFPVMPIKVAIRPTSKQIAAGINWAIKHGARVINISLKVLRQPVVTAALEDAWNAGVVVCAASGNFSARYPFYGIDFPASHPLVIAVGATDGQGRRKRISKSNLRDWGSQYGPELDVVAPGLNIATIDDRGPSGAAPGDYSLKGTGTSLACPQVTGLAALVMGIAPELSNQAVRDLIEGSCIQLRGYRFSMVRGRRWKWNREVGYGEISRDNCLDHLALQKSNSHIPKEL